jgi:hypothetical protein
MDTQTFVHTLLQYSPYAILGSVSIASIVLVWKSAGHIQQSLSKAVSAAGHIQIKSFLEKHFSFFHLMVIVCMLASMIHGSHLFSTVNDIPIVNVLLAAVLDIGIWILMDACIKLKRQGKHFRSFSLLVPIAVLCTVSFIANLVYNIQFHSAADFSNIDTQYVPFLEYLQSCPPLVIVVITIVANVVTKKDIPETEIDLQQQLDQKSKEKLARLEHRLKLKHDKQALQAKYTGSGVSAQSLAWSFLGFKKYKVVTPAAANTDITRLEETVQKISVAIVHLQQQITVHVKEEPREEVRQLPTPASIEAPAAVIEEPVTIPQDSDNAHMQRDTDKLDLSQLKPIDPEPVATTDTPAELPAVIPAAEPSVYRRKKKSTV